jgi:hypothetical protein
MGGGSMIGLLFFGAIALWGVIAIALGIKLPKWLGIQRYRVLWSVVLVPLIFFAPVADEVIAYPQMQALCASLKPYELAPGMDEKRAYERVVYHKQSSTSVMLWPPTIEVTRWTSTYVDSKTKEPVLVQSWIEPRRGMLGVPAGSSGGQMTVLLKKCSPKNVHYDSKGHPSQFGHLNLTHIPTP